MTMTAFPWLGGPSRTLTTRLTTEWAYQHRNSMRELGRQAGRDLAQRTWRKTAEAFHKIIHETFRGARPWPARGQRDAASQPSSATAASPASLSPHAKLAGS